MQISIHELLVKGSRDRGSRIRYFDAHSTRAGSKPMLRRVSLSLGMTADKASLAGILRRKQSIKSSKLNYNCLSENLTKHVTPVCDTMSHMFHISPHPCEILALAVGEINK